jgi:hypothetical protein
MVIDSPGWRVGAAFGTKIAANLGLPAERMSAKNGSHPMGDFRVLDHSSSSFQSLLETSARSLHSHQQNEGEMWVKGKHT